MRYKIAFIDTNGEPIFCGIVPFVPRIGERVFRTVVEVYTIIDILYVMLDGATETQLINITVRREF